MQRSGCAAGPLLQYIPAEGLLIVSGCYLPEQLVIRQGSCNRVHREELADDRLVFHQLQCGVGGALDLDGNKYIPGLEPAAKVAYLASVLPFAISHWERGRVVYGERSLSKWAYLPFLILFTSHLEGERSGSCGPATWSDGASCAAWTSTSTSSSVRRSRLTRMTNFRSCWSCRSCWKWSC